MLSPIFSERQRYKLICKMQVVLKRIFEQLGLLKIRLFWPNFFVQFPEIEKRLNSDENIFNTLIS